MTSHELARKLLEGPDLPVVTQVRCSRDTIWSDDGEEIEVKVHDNRIIYLSANTDAQFELLDGGDLEDEER